MCLQLPAATSGVQDQYHRIILIAPIAGFRPKGVINYHIVLPGLGKPVTCGNQCR